jgi:hypothetical protein
MPLPVTPKAPAPEESLSLLQEKHKHNKTMIVVKVVFFIIVLFYCAQKY